MNKLTAVTHSPLIIDQTGRPMQRSSVAHSASSMTSQELMLFNPGLRSADAAWLPDRDTAVGRIHHMVDNNGWAAGAVRRMVDQAIGPGFRFSWRPDYRALGIEKEWVEENKRQVESRFQSFANDPRNFIDATEQNNLSGILCLLFRHWMMDGESLAVAHWRGNDGSKYKTCIQVVDPDRLSNQHGNPDSDTLRGGVEIDEFGAPRSYHIRAGHPGDVFTSRGQSFRWERVPRRTPHGRQRVLHYFEQERAGQTRGKPVFAPVLEKLKMMDRYGRAEMQAALLNATMPMFIESPFDHSALEDAINASPDYQKGREVFHGDNRLTVEGIKIPILYPGEKANFPDASRPNSGFGEFERDALRYFAAAVGQSYEQVAQDWSSTNYSSARASLLEAWKYLRARRDGFSAGSATPIFGLWLEEDMDMGNLALPSGAQTFWENPAAWCRGKWIGPGRGWVDPTKEALAAQIRMEIGVSTLREECAEQGEDWQEVAEQRAAELKYLDEHNLPRPAWALTMPDANEDTDEQDRKDKASQSGAPH